MSPTSVSPPGDPDKPASSFFIPPPIQRLSRSFTGLSSSSKLPLDRPMQPLPGPNRAPSIVGPPPSQPSSSRPSSIFPRLHRLEIADDMACNQRERALLELKLSSSSFLDAVATDTESDKPLYAVETVGASTTVWRTDPWDGSAKIADLRWPKDLPLKGKGRDHVQGAMIQMDDPRWREATSLLKCSGLGSSRKFHIPYHPHVLKWKREGNTYMCTTPSYKGAVAILDLFNNADTAPRLRVFENLGSFHQSVPRLDHAGISLSFLDHLFVTALLLVTEPQDWMTLARNPTSLDGDRSIPLLAPLPIASNTRASNRQWRKIMYGEPLYPSLQTPSFDKGVVNGREDADILDSSDPPPSLTSRRQWRKIVYREPLYPSLRPQSVDGLDLPPRPSTATSFSSESYSPPTPSSAPSTGFYDPLSLFDDTERATSHNSNETREDPSPTALSLGTLSPMPSSECIPMSPFPLSPAPGSRRELPSPPSSYQPPRSIQPWLHRSRSSPKLSLSSQSPTLSAVDQEDATNQNSLTRIATGLNVRQLPTPPQQELPVQSPQTLTGPVETRRWSQTHQRSLPPTPGSVSRSSSTQPQHTHSLSHEVAPQSLPVSTIQWPSTSHQGSSVGLQNDGTRRPRHEKDPDEVINWMRNMTRAHRRRLFDGEDDESGSSPSYDGTYEAPPPAYNAIDFSTPPQARAPAEGSES